MIKIRNKIREWLSGLRSSLPGAFALAMTLLAASCGSNDVPEPNPGPNPDSGREDVEVTLRLKVSVLGDDIAKTRAFPDEGDNGFQAPATKYEKLHTLRVIIVDSLGNIEHNRMVNLNDAQQIVDGNLEFKVTVPYVQVPINGVNVTIPVVGHKRVWLFGNEKAANTDICRTFVEKGYISQPLMENIVNGGELALGLLEAGKKFPKETVEAIELRREAGSPYIDNSGSENTCSYIPMSEFFDVSIDPVKAIVTDGQASYIQTEHMFLTRSLVKFTFSARFGEDNLSNDEKMRISAISVTDLAERGYFLPNSTVYDTEKYTESTNKDDGRLITSFNVPQNVVKSLYKFIPPAGENDSFLVLKEEPAKGKRNVYTAYKYFPETKLSGDNRYYVSLKAEVYNDETNSWDELSYGPVPLRGLASNPVDLLDIPRNTHVYVNFLFNDYGVNAVVDLVPYTGVWLEPEFGIPTTE